MDEFEARQTQKIAKITKISQLQALPLYQAHR